jgi:hypothetical protein
MKNRALYMFLAISLTLLTCKKKEEFKEWSSFTVDCEGCSISYAGEDDAAGSENNISGKFEKNFERHVNVEITIKIKTTATVAFFIRNKDNYSNIYTKTFRQDGHLTYSKDSKSVNDGSSSNTSGSSNTGCGIYNGRSLYLGPKGGCYYLTSSGNKTYVDRGYCKCN